MINKPDKRHAVLVARREGDAPLDSRFVNLIQVSRSNDVTVRAVQRLDSDQNDGVAVRIKLCNGMEDVILSTDSDDGEIRAGGVTLHGRYGWVRRDGQGQVVRMQLVRGTSLTCNGVQVTCPTALESWTLQASEEQNGQLQCTVKTDTDTTAPPPGTVLLAESAPDALLPYVRNHAIPAPAAVSGPEGPVFHFSQEALSIAHLVIDAVPDDHTLRFTYPSELGYHPETGAFNGRLLVRDGVPKITTRIRRLVQNEDGRTSRTAEVESVEGFHVGDAVRVLLLQPAINSDGPSTPC